jgi:glutamate formiminotransferase
VFFYEEAATSEARRNRGRAPRQYEGMRGSARRVDGRCRAAGFNERSGVTAVGARMPLIAFNVNLLTDDIEVAKRSRAPFATSAAACAT